MRLATRRIHGRQEMRRRSIRGGTIAKTSLVRARQNENHLVSGDTPSWKHAKTTKTAAMVPKVEKKTVSSLKRFMKLWMYPSGIWAMAGSMRGVNPCVLHRQQMSTMKSASRQEALFHKKILRSPSFPSEKVATTTKMLGANCKTERMSCVQKQKFLNLFSIIRLLAFSRTWPLFYQTRGIYLNI